MARSELQTRDKILAAAQEEFLQKGYQGAWLRDIARNAGVTTGALYGYFKNKEELFGALVGEAYHGILDLYRQLLQQFSQLPPDQQQTSMVDHSHQGMVVLTDFVYAHREAFKLILSCSEDTEYSDLIDRMAALDEDATGEFTQAANACGAPVQRMEPLLEHIITTGLFTMFFELILHDIPKEEADRYLSQLWSFSTAGCAQIMGF